MLIAADKLKLFIERIERLTEEKNAIADDIKNVFDEAKGDGFDTKIMRKVIQLRKLEKHELEEQDALLDVYRSAVGIAHGITPIEQAIEDTEQTETEDMAA